MTWASKGALLAHLTANHPQIAHDHLSFGDLDQAHETLHSLTETDPWQLSRDHPDAYASWQYLVANGDTMRGFTDHLAHYLELETE